MFTGLIESIGTLTAVSRRGDTLVFEVRPEPPLADLRLGESVSLDGYCQTVVAVTGGTFAVEVSPETVAVTTAGERRAGQRLNLERALKVGDRLGGHLLAGHVDATGTVRAVREQDRFVVLAVDAPEAVLRYCVPKGSIAVDGISLTINKLDDNVLEVGIIPHTWQATTLRERVAGSRVNLEADLIGKYIERFVRARFGAEKNGLDEEFLAKHGFFD